MVTLSTIARHRGVSRVGVPPASLIEARAGDADYVDTYGASVSPMLVPDIAALEQYAFQRAILVQESDFELIYTGASPGLIYYISYHREPSDRDDRLAVTTTVHYKDWRGRLYFAVIRPFHRVLTPFMVSVMIRKANRTGA